MVRKLTHVAISLAVVLTAYFAYALLAVRMIEPEIERSSLNLTARPSNPLKRWKSLLKTHFGENSWVLDNPKILQLEHGLMLIKDYHIGNDNTMDLKPFAMVFFPSKEVQDNPNRSSEAIILEAPSANLRFEGDVDLRRAKIGRLKTGRLVGDVTIRSDQKLPGPEDDLLIRTSNVQLRDSEIWTASNVDFRFGPNWGVGREMHIEMQAKDEANPKKSRGPKIGGMKTFKLMHDVQMQIQMAGKGLLPGASIDKKKVVEKKISAKPKKPPTPVLIQCVGPFQFDMKQQIASFKENVLVQRLQPNEKHDRITCQLLEVFFESKKKNITVSDEEKAKQSLGKLQASAIRATGNPVIVNSPSTGASAKCQQLDYHIQTRKITLFDDKEAVLKDPQREMHAPWVSYQPGAEGTLGIVDSKGPGWLSGRMKLDDPKSAFYVQWGKELKIHPQDNRQLLSILGGSVVRLSDEQKLTADNIWFWMKVVPKSKNANVAKSKSTLLPMKSGIQPDQMVALGNVVATMPQITADTSRLEVWFRQKQIVEKKENTNPSSGGRVRPSPLGGSRSEPKKPTSHYKIKGNLVRIKVLQEGDSTQAEGVQVVGNVKVTETQLQTTTEKPLLIRGHELTVQNASNRAAVISINGDQRLNGKDAWAYLEAKGLTLSGQQIVLNRGVNKLWIPGAGKMTLPLDRDLQGNPISRPQTVAITWKKRMDFDGRAIVYQDQVEVRGQSQRTLTKVLEVQLAKRVDFSKPPKKREKTDLSKLICRGGVWVENRKFDKNGLVSIETISAKDLDVDQQTGNIFAAGPGWIKSIGIGTVNSLNIAGDKKKKIKEKPQKTGLNFMLVNFNKQIKGNLHQKVLVFSDQIKTVYGPVKKWDEELNPDKLDSVGENGVVMNCQKLTLTQIADVNDAKKTTVDLAAEGNTLVENPTFTARADRITFSQAKDLLILQGGSRSDAQLWHQARVGGPVIREAARKILYWRGTKRVEFEDIKYLNVNRSPEANRQPQPNTRSRQ